MSQSIQVAHVQQYKANIIAKYQQQGSKLRGCVSFDADIRGKVFYAELLAATEVVKKTTRHGDTPLNEQTHSRRQGTFSDYHWADMIDKSDIIRMLINPESAYVTNASNAMGRGVDKEIIECFNRDVLEGENGETTVTFAGGGGQTIVHGAAGLTRRKIVEAREFLSSAEVPEEGRYIAYSPRALSYLLMDNELTSFDRMNIKMLMAGHPGELLGFEWKLSTLLPKTANIRKLFAWHRDAVVLAEPQSFMVDVGPRRDKSLSTQVYVESAFGAVRRQDPGVVVIEIDESVALPA